MIQPLRRWEDPMLVTPCQIITDFSQAHLVFIDLKDTIKELRRHYPFNRGIGLAAPQIGIGQQIAVIEHPTLPSPLELINPKLVDSSQEKSLISEGCISLFDCRASIPRYSSVVVAYQDQSQQWQKISTSDPEVAMLLQHELDHLAGKRFCKHLDQFANHVSKVSSSLPNSLFFNK